MLDNQNKRLSVISMGRPFVATLPIPDGTVAQHDRQHLLYMVSIVAGVFVSAPDGLRVASRQTPYRTLSRQVSYRPNS